MVLNNGTLNAINIFLQILIYSASIATPVVIILILLYQYDKYIKWTKKEEKEAERIIVKMNKEIIESTNTINNLKPLEEELKAKIKELEEKAEGLTSMLDGDEEEIEPDISTLTVNELHQIAKARGLKGYSRLSKDKLLELLQ